MSSRMTTGHQRSAHHARNTVVFAIAICAVALNAGVAQARDLYLARIQILALEETDSTNKFKEVGSFFSDASLDDLFGPNNHPDSDALSASLNLRGLEGTIAFSPGSVELTFTLGNGRKVILEGSTREESADMFEDWLLGKIEGKTGSNLTSTDLLQAVVAFSPVDPVAGNPNSLQSRMAFADYAMATRGPLLGETHSGEDLFGIGAHAGSFDGCDSRGCMDVSSVDLPINYSWNFEDSNFSLLIDFPIAATFTEGQWSALASIGLGFQYRPQPFCQLVRAVGCALTGGFRVGGVGSVDVGALAVLYSLSLTNHMQWEIWGFRVGVANYFGYNSSFDGIEVGGFAFDYDLSNGIFRNGGYIANSFGVKLLSQELGWEIFGADTRYSGTDLWMDSSAEFGVALVTLGEISGARYNKTRIAASYVWGKGYDGASITLDFLF